MSIASIVTRGFIDGSTFIPTRGYSSGSSPVPPTITGGHFLPANHKHKRTLSNVLTIYNKAKELPRIETKELRDSISDFVDPSIALLANVPDIIKVDYDAIQANDAAYEKFHQALANIEQYINIFEQQKITLIAKQEEEDDELLLMTIISCLIH